MSIEWKSVMPAVTTKFTDDDQLDQIKIDSHKVREASP